MGNFIKAFKFTLGNEGGYTNDPADRGGPTNWGITQADYSAWCASPQSAADVKMMPQATAQSIYSHRYWYPLACDKIKNDGIGTAFFDIGVVRGIAVPPRYAQEICNTHGASLVLDGHIGPLTLAAINELDHVIFIKDFSARVEQGFRSIVSHNPSQHVFLRGWVNRARRLLTLI